MSCACLCKCNIQYLLWCLVHDVYVVLCMYMWWWWPNRNLLHCSHRPLCLNSTCTRVFFNSHYTTLTYWSHLFLVLTHRDILQSRTKPSITIKPFPVASSTGDHSEYELSPWEATLHWNTVSHWLSPYLNDPCCTRVPTLRPNHAAQKSISTTFAIHHIWSAYWPYCLSAKLCKLQ